jgi:hypothetical protein
MEYRVESVKDQVWERVESQVRGRVWGRIRRQVRSQIGDRIEVQVLSLGTWAFLLKEAIEKRVA